MHRPPGYKGNPLLITRNASDWNNRVSRKHKELASLNLSQEQRLRLDLLVEAEFVYSTLKLEGIDLGRAEIARLVASQTTAGAQSGPEASAAGLLEAIRVVESVARAEKRAATLTPDLLLRLQAHVSGEGAFRTTPGGGSRLFKPPAADHLPASIEGACRWFMADSFAELNPIEQASIVYLRLIELQPFEKASERGSLVAASLFTLRSDLPPLVVKPERAADYGAALEEGFRMNTRAMVEFMAEAIEATLGEMLAAGKVT